MVYEWEQERAENRQTLLNLGIDDNTQLCLARGGIFCYEDLLQRLEEVRRFRGIGPTRLARIMTAIRAMGYEIPEGADVPWKGLDQARVLAAQRQERWERRFRHWQGK
jgi:hypothetical protein